MRKAISYIVTGVGVMIVMLNRLASGHTLPGDLNAIWIAYLSELTPAAWILVLVGVGMILWSHWPDIKARIFGIEQSKGIQWISLAESLKRHQSGYSKVHLTSVSAQQPICVRLSSAFKSAGWKVGGVLLSYDSHPNAGAYNYVEGIKISGHNRNLINTLKRDMENAGFSDIITEELDIGGITPDHPKWPHVQASASILIGHPTPKE